MRHFSIVTILLFLSTVFFLFSCTNDQTPFSTQNVSPTKAGSLNETASGGSKIVFVAPPTGDVQTDRASIEMAVSQAEPGDIIQLAKGTYVIGAGPEGVVIDVPYTILQGHPGGTVLKGGDNISYWGEYEGIILTGGNQVVRHITFKSFSVSAVNLNWDFYAETGGYLVENNRFLNCYSAVTYFGQSDQVSLVAHNLVDNNSSPFWVLGKTCHIKWNKIMSTQPDQTPLVGYPGNAGAFWALGNVCENNVFAFNTIMDLSDGFQVGSFAFADDPVTVNRNNIVMHNKFFNQTIYDPNWDLGTMVFMWRAGPGGPVEDNKIINNVYEGAGGIAINLWGVSKTIIARNSIRNVSMFPNTFVPTGYGIFVDGYSHGNKLLRNRFHNNKEFDIGLYGNHNLVVGSSPQDKILDEGENNTIIGPGIIMVQSLPVQKNLREIQQRKMKKSKKLLTYLRDRFQQGDLVARDLDN